MKDRTATDVVLLRFVQNGVNNVPFYALTTRCIPPPSVRLSDRTIPRVRKIHPEKPLTTAFRAQKT